MSRWRDRATTLSRCVRPSLAALVFSGNLSPSTAANSQLSCTREIYEASIHGSELCDTARATVGISWSGGKNSAVARSRVSRCLGATTKKRQKEDVRTRRTSKKRKRAERSSGAGYTQVRERVFLSVPLGFLATSGSKMDV